MVRYKQAVCYQRCVELRVLIRCGVMRWWLLRHRLLMKSKSVTALLLPFLVTAGWYKWLLSPTIKWLLKQTGLGKKLQKKGLIFNPDQVSGLSLSSMLSCAAA